MKVVIEVNPTQEFFQIGEFSSYIESKTDLENVTVLREPTKLGEQGADTINMISGVVSAVAGLFQLLILLYRWSGTNQSKVTISCPNGYIIELVGENLSTDEIKELAQNMSNKCEADEQTTI